MTLICLNSKLLTAIIIVLFITLYVSTVDKTRNTADKFAGTSFP